MKMKVLMVGLGSIGQRHLRNLRTILGENLEVAAYRVLRESPVLTAKMEVEAGSNLEEKYQLKVFTELDAALDWGPCFVCICNPNHLHVPVALAAARAGCHLFVEKPLSHSMEDVEELIAIADRKKLVGFVTYQMRFHPCLQRTHALLREGAIGRVLAVRAEMGEYMPGWHPWEDYRQSYAAKRSMGGGCLLAQIHEMDFLYWLFGLPQRVFAVGGHLSTLEVDVEDVASVLMDVEGTPVHLHLDYIQRPPSRTLQVVGNSGKILVDLRASSIQVYGEDGGIREAVTFDKFERNQMFIDELNHFLACIDGKEQSLITLRDGAQSLRMALAAKESLETGKAVELK